jgi:hypothetical protein
VGRVGKDVSCRVINNTVARADVSLIHTSDDLRTLEVLVRVEIAWRQREVDAHEYQQEVASAPHDGRCEVGLSRVERGQAHGVAMLLLLRSGNKTGRRAYPA